MSATHATLFGVWIANLQTSFWLGFPSIFKQYLVFYHCTISKNPETHVYQLIILLFNWYSTFFLRGIFSTQQRTYIYVNKIRSLGATLVGHLLVHSVCIAATFLSWEVPRCTSGNFFKVTSDDIRQQWLVFRQWFLDLCIILRHSHTHYTLKRTNSKALWSNKDQTGEIFVLIDTWGLAQTFVKSPDSHQNVNHWEYLNWRPLWLLPPLS